MPCRPRAIIAIQVHGKIAEKAHRQFPEFPANFPRHFENKETVDPGLILSSGCSVGEGWIAAAIMNIKGIAVTGVIINCRRNLRVESFREIEFRSYLPRQQKCVGIWN